MKSTAVILEKSVKEAIVKKKQVKELLMNEKDTVPIETALSNAKKKWSK